MRSRIATGAAVLGLVIALAGCTGTSGGSDGTSGGSMYGGETPAETETPDAGAASATTLMTADSELGEIVVDGEGMTVYMFDTDTQGGDGQCATNWPAVTTDADAPEVEGVTGEVGTITGVDGSTQVTLDGWPLYTYAGDDAAGDVNGQGVDGVWWVLSPAGDKIGG